MAEFEEAYWTENYSKPESMDGVFNADRHVRYMKSVFDLEFVHIGSIIDFGFGLGHLFEAALEAFIPARAAGIEPSLHAFEQVRARDIRPVDGMRLTLKNEDLQTWCARQKKRSWSFDLGLCTSVLQYLSDEDLEHCLPVMAEKVRYLYLSVPTDRELDHQVQELGFRDRWAIRRSREQYLEMLEPHFTVFSARLLESRSFFDEASTRFTDLLYRF